MQIEYIYAFIGLLVIGYWLLVTGYWLLVICGWLFIRFLELVFLLVGDNLNSRDIFLLASFLRDWL